MGISRLRVCLGWLFFCGLVGFAGLIQPPIARAGEPAKEAFQARSVAAAMAALGVAKLQPGNQVLVDLPDIVEANAEVPLTVRTTLRRADWVAVLVERNPFPLAAQFELSESLAPEISASIRVERTSRVRVIVRAEGKFYEAAREVKVAYRDD